MQNIAKIFFFFFQILIKIFISLFNKMHQGDANIDKKFKMMINLNLQVLVKQKLLVYIAINY